MNDWTPVNRDDHEGTALIAFLFGYLFGRSSRPGEPASTAPQRRGPSILGWALIILWTFVITFFVLAVVIFPPS